MTEVKHVAKSIKDLMESPTVSIIQDPSSNIMDAVENVLGYWNYDLMSRKPGPAYTSDGIFIGTDLDLACFLYALKERGAVLNLPEYKGFRQIKFKEGQSLVSKSNRHGKIVGLVSNRNNFTFSIRILDSNIISSESVGDFRTFSLTHFDGDWYDGWQKIEFLPDAKENKFMTENKLWSGNSVMFKNFVHPNRWVSFFGKHYIESKLLIQRLTEERSHLNSIKKKMIEAGIDYPLSDSPSAPKSYIDSTVDKGKQIKVKSFNVEIDFPKKEGKFENYEESSSNLKAVSDLWKYFGKVVESLQFMTRATELAHFNAPDRFPSWLKNVSWENDYVQKGKRIKWDRLVLFQPGVGQTAVSIRKREFEKAERVSENYQE